MRGLLASTFNRLVKAVALAADEEEKHVEEVGQAVADACHAKGGRYMDAIRTDLGSSIEADGEVSEGAVKVVERAMESMEIKLTSRALNCEAYCCSGGECNRNHAAQRIYIYIRGVYHYRSASWDRG